MLGKTLGKIDRFYPIMGVVLIALLALVLFSLRSVLNGINTASEFDPAIATARTKIDVPLIEKAYKATFDKQVQKLDLAQ